MAGAYAHYIGCFVQATLARAHPGDARSPRRCALGIVLRLHPSLVILAPRPRPRMPHVAGAGVGGTTGTALVEIYDVP